MTHVTRYIVDTRQFFYANQIIIFKNIWKFVSYYKRFAFQITRKQNTNKLKQHLIFHIKPQTHSLQIKHVITKSVLEDKNPTFHNVHHYPHSKPHWSVNVICAGARKLPSVTHTHRWETEQCTSDRGSVLLLYLFER